ncbi:hypothetical protein [Lentzea sp. NPDC059081]|uniref:hypothetical protein n=1 Tax=Lentzea sp. NPDC059081 TaxID=3346719 RepID=UPI0036A33F86
MRKAVLTGVAVAVVALGLVLGLTGVSGGPSPIRSDADPTMINNGIPVCSPGC